MRGVSLRALAVVLAVGLSAAWVTGSSAASRIQERDTALAGSQAQVAHLAAGAVAYAAPGDPVNPGDAPNGAVINGPLGDPTSVLTKINDRLDPMQVSSGLYPLRKAFEQLSIWILVPLLFLSLAKAVAMGVNRGDAQLAEVAKQLAVVVVLMWSYTLWDVVIFRFVAVPVAGALSNKTTLAAVATAASGGRRYTSADVGTPVSNMSVQAQRGTACSVNATVPECNVGGVVSQVARDAIVREVESNGVSGGNSEDGTRDWLSITPTGIITSIVSFVLAAVMWFIWLGVIVGRAFSLCLAPMALAWGMLNKDKAYQWFRGHAGICLMPVSFSFATLIVWALNVAVFNSPTGSVFPGGTIVGLGLKTALCVVMMMTLFKSGALAKMISGDVAAAAATIGTAVRDRTIQFATTGVKGASTGAGLLSHAEGRREAHQALANSATRIRTGASDKDRLGQLAMLGRASKEAVRGTLAAAGWAYRHRTAAPQYTGANSITQAKTYSWDKAVSAYSAAKAREKKRLKDAEEKQKEREYVMAQIEAEKTEAVMRGFPKPMAAETPTLDHAALVQASAEALTPVVRDAVREALADKSKRHKGLSTRRTVDGRYGIRVDVLFGADAEEYEYEAGSLYDVVARELGDSGTSAEAYAEARRRAELLIEQGRQVEVAGLRDDATEDEVREARVNALLFQLPAQVEIHATVKRADGDGDGEGGDQGVAVHAA